MTKSLVERWVYSPYGMQPDNGQDPYRTRYVEADRIEELEAERDKWIKKAAAYTANWLNERDHSAKLERVLLDFPTIGKSTADLIKRIKAWLPARAEALAACEEKDDD